MHAPHAQCMPVHAFDRTQAPNSITAGTGGSSTATGGTLVGVPASYEGVRVRVRSGSGLGSGSGSGPGPGCQGRGQGQGQGQVCPSAARSTYRPLSTQ